MSDQAPLDPTDRSIACLPSSGGTRPQRPSGGSTNRGGRRVAAGAGPAARAAAAAGLRRLRQQPARRHATIHLLDYVRVLYKRRWTAITAFLVVFVSVDDLRVHRHAHLPAKVQILIEKENANVVSFKEAFEQNQIADDYYQTQYKILQSRALARRTLDALQLWDAPAVQPGARRQDVLDRPDRRRAGRHGLRVVQGGPASRACRRRTRRQASRAPSTGSWPD